MATVDLEYPFAVRWLVQNSPADRVPSHGTALFATSHAIDFVPVGRAGRTAPVTLGSLVRPESPARFPGFGRLVLAPADRVVAAVHGAEPDHPAYRGVPSIAYAATQRRRVSAGWVELAGNYVLIDVGTAMVALCHLQRGSVAAAVGDTVRTGEPIARCGNSGNSTEPHLHVQAIDRTDVERPGGVRMTPTGRCRATETLPMRATRRVRAERPTNSPKVASRYAACAPNAPDGTALPGPETRDTGLLRGPQGSPCVRPVRQRALQKHRQRALTVTALTGVKLVLPADRAGCLRDREVCGDEQ